MPWELPESLNIADRFLDRQVREGRADKVALRHDDGELTYREVQWLANRFALVLADLGVRQEERVLLALPDIPEFVGALFGALKLGAVPVMVNPAFQTEEVAQLYRYCRPSVAVVHHTLVTTFAAAAVGLPHPRELLVVGGEGGSHPTFEARAAALASTDIDAFKTVATHRDDPALWLFSGGTTGRPKAVVQTHRSFANTTELYARRALGYRETDVTLSVPKLFFGYATGSNLFFPFSVGATAVLFTARPTAEELFAQIRRHRPTILIHVPTMINHMVHHPEAREQDLSSLRFATSAGEALPVPLYEAWKERFGVELLDGLGTAEMWHIFVTNRPGDVRPGTLGKVVEGFEIAVRNEEGDDVPVGEPGRLWVRGESRALGYHQNLDKTVESFRGEWFVGGDLVSRDADGYVTYHGRGDDMMKVGGKWVSPKEVEGCLMRHPAVAECAVIGVTNEQGLTKPYAFVAPTDQATPGEALAETLKAFVLENLSPHKHPRQILFVEAMPRTHLGKIDRGALRGRL
jgi:benzoate-CoA ligase family protein